MDYSRYKAIKVEIKDRVAIFTLNRPEVLNAFDASLHVEMEDLFEDVSVDREVNAIILTGAGRAFSAGGDIRALDAGLRDPSLSRISLEGARRLINNLLSVDQPIIAALNGDAVGLGATIALFCDIIIAAENARIGDPHVRVGVVAGDGGAVIWPLLMGPARAKEYLMTGDLISAREADRLGLVNHVVSAQELMPMAMALAQRLAKGPTKAIQFTKISVNKWLKQQVNLILDTSLGLEFLTMHTSDHVEAVRSLIEKREPRFTGK